MDFFTSSKPSMMLISSFVLACFIFMSCIPSGSAVFCYECSSVDDKECMDPFDKLTRFYINCSIEYPQATFCRKIDQTLNNAADNQNKHRIFRRCAWEEHKNRDCYYGTNTDYKAEICICRGDGCNEARISSAVGVVTVTAAMILAVRHLVAT